MNKRIQNLGITITIALSLLGCGSDDSPEGPSCKDNKEGDLVVRSCLISDIHDDVIGFTLRRSKKDSNAKAEATGGYEGVLMLEFHNASVPHWVVPFEGHLLGLGDTTITIKKSDLPQPLDSALIFVVAQDTAGCNHEEFQDGSCGFLSGFLNAKDVVDGSKPSDGSH